MRRTPGIPHSGEFEIAVEAVFGEPDEERQAEERLQQSFKRVKTLGSGCLMYAFYDYFKDRVMDELDRIDRPDTLDACIEEAVKIYGR
ncbi:hypothetical protein MFIFM68171_02577 [Madurella fahalii]|uniref:Uncharacterized protein n=1 Tax=Madurella fahalii TaxID=1157608 RepID=A0ABQ0G3M6_9PEZI